MLYVAAPLALTLKLPGKLPAVAFPKDGGVICTACGVELVIAAPVPVPIVKVIGTEVAVALAVVVETTAVTA